MADTDQQVSIFTVEADGTSNQEFRRLLNDNSRINLLGTSPSLSEAMTKIHELKPDVVAIKISAQQTGQIDLLKDIRAGSPLTQILAIVDDVEPDVVAKLIENGASGICSNDLTDSDVLMVVRATASGSIWIAPSLATIVRRLITEGAGFAKGGAQPRLITSALTERENEILRHMARGLSNQRIANELHLSVETVKTYVRRIMDKSSIRTRRQLLSQFESSKAAADVTD